MEKQNTTQLTTDELQYVQPFVDIQNRLAQKVPGLLYIDEDWGQLDYFGNNLPVQWPCALIDCSTISVSQMGSHVMLDEIGIIIRIADMRISNSSEQSTDFQKKAHYQLFAIIAEVVHNLHGWTGSPDTYGRLQRISQLRRQRNDGVRLYEVGFVCQLINKASVKPVTMVPATPIIHRD